MNFKNTFQQITDFLEKKQIPYAVIGAFALKAYGYVRATQDVDFIIRVEDQERIIRYLESIGYETLHRSTGFSNHQHPITKLSRIDFVYVSGETSLKIFQEIRRLPLFGEPPLPVVCPEHLAALKIFAMKNDPERALQEMADIKFLLSLPGVDVKIIKGYFQKYGQMEKFHAIVREK